MSNDRPGRHLARAWVLAENGRDRTNPNPFVGCVIERDGTILGEGWTQAAGGHHAEIVALRQAGEAARGATAWVTLEPCNHVGRTGPCSQALLDAGIARVVIAARDPNVAATGGARVLGDQGVTVEFWPWESWIRQQNERFVTVVAEGRPWVTLKLAATRAGALVTEERWITGPEARAEVHRLRASADAVLVGSGTVLADDPGLDVRDAPLLRGQPRPVVFDRRGRTPATARVVRRGALIVTGGDADPGWRETLSSAGAEVVIAEPGLEAALAAVAERDIQHVLAEPGAGLATALIAAGVVDEVILHQAPGEGPAALPTPLVGHDWHHVRTRPLGDDVETVLRPRDP